MYPTGRATLAPAPVYSTNGKSLHATPEGLSRIDAPSTRTCSSAPPANVTVHGPAACTAARLAAAAWLPRGRAAVQSPLSATTTRCSPPAVPPPAPLSPIAAPCTRRARAAPYLHLELPLLDRACSAQHPHHAHGVRQVHDASDAHADARRALRARSSPGGRCLETQRLSRHVQRSRQKALAWRVTDTLGCRAGSLPVMTPRRRRRGSWCAVGSLRRLALCRQSNVCVLSRRRCGVRQGSNAAVWHLLMG